MRLAGGAPRGRGSMRKRVLVLILAALLVFGVVPISSAATPAYTAGEDFMVAGGYEGQTSPDIDYPWIVYHDGATCPASISVYNFATDEYVHIVVWDSSIYGFNNPSISGNWIVFGTDTESGYGSIYAVDLMDPETIAEPILIADGEDVSSCYGNPAIEGTTAVFRRDDNGGIYAIDVTDLASGMWLVSDTYDDDGLYRYGPEIGDGWVVCKADTSYKGSGSLEAYKISGRTVVDTVVIDEVHDATGNLAYDGPSTADGMLVYQQSGSWDYTGDPAPDSGTAIMLRDLEAGTTMQLSDSDANTSGREHPVINDGLVSWHDMRGGNWEVYVYDLASDVETCLVEAVDDLYAGRTSTADGIVAWHDHRDGDGDDSDADLYAMFVGSTPPAPAADAYGTVTGNTLSVAAPGVLANDTDPDDDSLTAELVTGVANGALALHADGSFTYTPNAAFVGTDSFTYVVNDDVYSGGPTTVTIVVIPSGEYAAGSVVYRFYNPGTGTHFFTSSVEERNNVIAQYPGVWHYEGVAFLSIPAAGTIPLHRFYNPFTRAHFYTASNAEKANVLATWPTLFTYEGTTFSVATGPGVGKVPVYRFYNVESRSHFYTTSAWEKDHIIATWPKVFRYEGIGYYVVAP